MREIKFRAWNKKKKEFKFIEIKGIEGCEETEQYTGLQDKNGKEIYEGDIFSYKVYPENADPYIQNHEIQFNNDVGWIGMILNGSWKGTWVKPKIKGDKTKIEVIGNIYENKELLK